MVKAMKINISPEEEVANHDVRGAELLLKHGHTEVVKSMKLYPAAIPHLLSKLAALNMRATPTAVQSPVASPAKMPMSRIQAAAVGRADARKRKREEESTPKKGEGEA